MRSLLCTLFSIAAFICSVFGQTNEGRPQMTLTEANKMLRLSGWAQMQVETDTSEMFYTPTRMGTSAIGAPSARSVSDQQSRNNNRADRGALNQAISVNYYVRFFSSRPIREALSKVALASVVEPGPKMIDQWQSFVDRDFGPFVVITVGYDSEDGRLLGPSIQAFAGATADTLKNNTYLERDDGKRVYVMDYRVPSGDGLGAKFIFPRRLENGDLFLKNPKGSVRFVADMSATVKLNVKFALSNMMVGDKLEY